jgi:hypothetical protein
MQAPLLLGKQVLLLLRQWQHKVGKLMSISGCFTLFVYIAIACTNLVASLDTRQPKYKFLLLLHLDQSRSS